MGGKPNPERFATAAAENGVTLRVELDERLTVQGDERLLRLIPFNLIDNDLKHGPRGGTVAVQGARDGATLRMQVSDEGPGIDEADLARVFDRFYRADAARSRPGSGLGLAIVRQIVEDHGGRVIAGRAPSGGAAVGFRLPTR